MAYISTAEVKEIRNNLKTSFPGLYFHGQLLFMLKEIS
tara:strand:+ start:405 stop:518 length:114 start_codon:yes stop_codon:yes gene_type:complete